MAPILGSVFWTPKWGPLFGPILQIPGKFLLAGIGPLKANRRQRKHTTCCNLMTSSEHAASAILVPMPLQTGEARYVAPVFFVVFGTHFGGRVKVQVFACCRCFVRGGSGDL